jgi:hypothetical protein
MVWSVSGPPCPPGRGGGGQAARPGRLGVGNFVVTGGGVGGFAGAVAAVHALGWLWSSFVDKKGDWAVSTADETHGDRLLAALGRAGVCCEVLRGGELVFLYEDALGRWNPELLGREAVATPGEPGDKGAAP